MVKYRCKKCKCEKKLQKQTLVILEKKIIVKEAICKCGCLMESKDKEGFPSLIRTEPTLKKS